MNKEIDLSSTLGMTEMEMAAEHIIKLINQNYTYDEVYLEGSDFKKDNMLMTGFLHLIDRGYIQPTYPNSFFVASEKFYSKFEKFIDQSKIPKRLIRKSEKNKNISNMIPNNKRPSWDEYFLKICETVKLRSEDLFVQHGAVLVDKFNRIIGTGYNALIPHGTYTIKDIGIEFTTSDLVDIKDRDARRKYMLHAERNAIRNCSVDIRLNNPCTMYITARPCFDCMQDMIASGIKRIVCYDIVGTITEDEDKEGIEKLIKVSNIEVLKVNLNK